MTYQVEIIYFYILQTENVTFLEENREREKYSKPMRISRDFFIK